MSSYTKTWDEKAASYRIARIINSGIDLKGFEDNLKKMKLENSLTQIKNDQVFNNILKNNRIDILQNCFTKGYRIQSANAVKTAIYSGKNEIAEFLLKNGYSLAENELSLYNIFHALGCVPERLKFWIDHGGKIQLTQNESECIKMTIDYMENK